MYVFQLVDYYLFGGYTLQILCFLEVVGVSWVYGKTSASSSVTVRCTVCFVLCNRQVYGKTIGEKCTHAPIRRHIKNYEKHKRFRHIVSNALVYVSEALVFFIVLYVSSYRWVNISRAVLFCQLHKQLFTHSLDTPSGVCWNACFFVYNRHVYNKMPASFSVTVMCSPSASSKHWTGKQQQTSGLAFPLFFFLLHRLAFKCRFVC